MKVVHITYSTTGGAGIAAYRLHRGLIDEGVDSYFLCLKNKLDDTKNIEVVPYPKLNLFQRVINKIKPIRQKVINKKQLDAFIGNYEIYSFPTSDYRIHTHPFIVNADIINLHWIGDFINFPAFFKNVKKPIIWTLHDMNPFQGGFHYKYDEDTNRENFKNLERQIFKIKKTAYHQSSINTIVSPSQWLMDLSLKSELLGQFKHAHIFNAINIDIFKPIDKLEARKTLGLPKDKIIFSFVSHSIDSYRKGFDILLEAIENINDKNLVFVAVGPIPLSKNEKINYLGPINNQETMANIYAASDAYLLTSREDNLPNTMVESLVIGTPVIASAVGGMLEVIRDGENGYLVNESRNFELMISEFIKNKSLFNSKEISETSKQMFASSVVSKEYIELYKSILNE